MRGNESVTVYNGEVDFIPNDVYRQIFFCKEMYWVNSLFHFLNRHYVYFAPLFKLSKRSMFGVCVPFVSLTAIIFSQQKYSFFVRISLSISQQISQITKERIKFKHTYRVYCYLGSWLRHHATSLKVAGSIPDEAIWIFNWPNPSSCNMSLGLTEPLTKMSTRNFPGGKGRPGRKADKLIATCEPSV
jgi:hypothetical protein